MTKEIAKQVQLEHMMPREVDAAQSSCPTLFLPLGTIEWHGFQNVLGLDSLKAHELCVQAALQGGGLVHPPLYGGVGGLDEPHTFIFDKEESIISNYLRPWLEQLIRESHRNGFKAIILLTGHYGAAQQIIVRECAVRMSKELSIPVLGVPEYFLGLDIGYYGDHAATFETSLMMHLHEGTVDLDRLGEAPHQGVHGEDPKIHATAEEGARLAEPIVQRLALLAARMPKWDQATRLRFVEAENALVSKQIELSTPATAWGAWAKVQEGALDNYPIMLEKEDFEGIKALAETL
ncbi:creatininase family protein [Pelagicoccus mobilis]|uniref:Creatininase family protein n=1 Tax=Pelagicoccus mobilis TaxID=415221 RepID=A0A934VRA3_9BACT|nr:creatininase family protein [Pelagicoccus mobilis]MBK1877418.1 creatininase family protein [Pelagicoccus mobilis]